MRTLLIRITPGLVQATIEDFEDHESAEVAFPVTRNLDALEFAPTEIWSAIISSTKQILNQTNLRPTEISNLKIISELDASVFWDDETLGAVRTAVSDENTHDQRVTRIIANDPRLEGTSAASRLVSGTLSEYLISRLTRGLHQNTNGTEVISDATSFAGISAAITA